MDKKIISLTYNLVYSDDSYDPIEIDFKSYDEALGVATMYKDLDDRHVWWIDEIIVYDDGSTASIRYDAI
jgi:hypothetical protein